MLTKEEVITKYLIFIRGVTESFEIHERATVWISRESGTSKKIMITD